MWTQKKFIQNDLEVDFLRTLVDTCGLPPESGSCYAHFTNWHYNAKKKKCVEFVYGGCGGNGNNFETFERCQSSCGNYTG